MNNRPLISFVIPFFNTNEKQFGVCLQSLVNQSVPKQFYEIIIIDDGSDFFPFALLKQYNSNNIFYKKIPHSGLSDARNAAYNMIRGDYVRFIDSDDYICKNAVDIVLPILKTGEYDCIKTGYQCVNPHNHTNPCIKINLSFKNYSGIKYLSCKNLNAGVWQYYFKKSSLICFKNNIFHEDELFTPLVLQNIKNIAVTNLIDYFYVRNQGSITTSTDTYIVSKRFDDLFNIICELESSSPVFQRRVHQLSMDFVYLICKSNVSTGYLSKLISAGFFPLKIKFYTLKYFIFSIFVRNILALKLLTFLLK